jgi:dihydrofolate reductase
MRVSMIWAEDEKGCIGKDGAMPWGRLDADMRWFRKITLGKVIIMGRKTYDSLPGPLKRRHNIVLTRQGGFKAAKGVTVVTSPEEALRVASDDYEVVIIGGAEIYQIYLPQVTTFYRTTVHHDFGGDTHFPDTGKLGFQMSHERRPADLAHPWDLTFEVFHESELRKVGAEFEPPAITAKGPVKPIDPSGVFRRKRSY